MKNVIILLMLLATIKTYNAEIPRKDYYRTPVEIVQMANKLGGK